MNKTALAIAISLITTPALATNKPPPKTMLEQQQEQYQAQLQEQTATGGTASSGATADASSMSNSTSAGGAAHNEGLTQEANSEFNDSSENNNTNLVLVPNNNTENCLRVWGISFGNNGSAGAVGIPWRSKKCDFEQAADDAFAAGEREIGWFWKCRNKNLAKQFKGKEVSWDEAYTNCHSDMVGKATNAAMLRTLKEEYEAQLAENARLSDEVEFHRLQEATSK